MADMILPFTLPFTLGGAEPAPGVSAPVSAAPGATVDVTIRLQALDGTWETCGADRAIGVDPETVQLTANEWGSDKASFDLHRSAIALWPDIGAFSPVEVEVGGVIVWEGRTAETPIRSGAEQVINVQCQGWQYHLDDDVYQRSYVHSKLTDWKDLRSSLTADLTFYTTVGQVQSGGGKMSISWPQGQATSPAANVGGALMLDLGPSGLAKRIVFDWALTAQSAGARVFYVGAGESPGGPEELTSVYSSLAAQAATTSAVTFATTCRYVFFRVDTSAHTPTADETLTITRALVFADRAYEAGNASILKSSYVVQDALARATILLSADASQINFAGDTFSIPDFTLSKASTPREAIEAANAYHNWITKLLTGRRFRFTARPTAPLLEIGAWSGSDIEDASANNGAEIYNRALVEATGPDGSPLAIERGAAQQPGVALVALNSPTPTNPSFAVNTAGWTVSSGALERDTAVFNSAPASGKIAAGPSNAVAVETIAGTFLAGVTYRVLVALRSSVAGTVLIAIGQLGNNAVAHYPIEPGGFAPFTVTWIPKYDISTATFRVAVQGVAVGNCWIDDVALTGVRPTLVDRRGFQRTKVIQMSSAITPAEGNQLADIFLQAHMTTPFKGSASVMPGGARTALGGQPVHPAALLLRTQELLRLSHLTDPDTGGIGRDGTIAEVTYTHKDRKAAVTLDDKRGNFDALLSRLAVVQSVGS